MINQCLMYEARMYEGRMFGGRMYEGRMYEGRMYEGTKHLISHYKIGVRDISLPEVTYRSCDL